MYFSFACPNFRTTAWSSLSLTQKSPPLFGSCFLHFHVSPVFSRSARNISTFVFCEIYTWYFPAFTPFFAPAKLPSLKYHPKNRAHAILGILSIGLNPPMSFR